ncbi:MAG: acyl-CoA synthetase [Gammaproteobacteria bacterium]|nr:acyl-CoA synthetase [Gammaproteobacteria bacterium]
MNHYEYGLDQNQANYTPLSPLSFLERAADVYPEYCAVIHGTRRYTWSETRERCQRLASALSQRGVGTGDTVSIIAPNIPEIFEAHYGVPMTGAVLNAINTRLDVNTIHYILEHCEAKVLLTDRESSPVVSQVLEKLQKKPVVIDIDDALATGGELIGECDYETFLQQGDPDFKWALPDNEWNAISLNYTSGTTGNPKGVVYHHRGAYMNAMSNITGWSLPAHPVYLWTLPMFHCNGWCFPWSLAAVAGTSVCCRNITAEAIYQSINDSGVTHLCGAPIIMNFIVNAPAELQKPLPHSVSIMTAAAPPPPSILSAIETLGFHVTHVYGLTETYGPAVMCAWKTEWDSLPDLDRAQKKSRQGVRYQVLEGLSVMDPETMQAVPADGETIGEIMFRGNIVMRGYYKNPDANREAFRDGWFHSGDLAVMDPDGYLRILDRSKDIIISGGENISSIEIENTLYTHPDVLEAAVAARPDDKWGETPCAFVGLKDGATTTEQELIDYCREHLAHFKCPKTIVFSELPKTSTGKIQKFVLRERAKALGTL